MARKSLASLDQFVDGFKAHPFVVGIDVHKRSLSVALLRADGKVHTFVCPADPHGLLAQTKRLGIQVSLMVQEAGPTGFGLARAFKGKGIKVIVAAPSRIPRSVAPGAKCDRLDCIKLAEFGARGMLKSIAIPTEQEQAQRCLLRRRHSIVDGVRRTKQRIKSLLLLLGVEEPKGLSHWKREALNELHRLPLEPSALSTMESHLRELEFHTQELRSVEAELYALAQTSKQAKSIEQMKTVPGVGPVVATTFAMELFRATRFKRAEELASYLGLAPMVHHSGAKNPSGRIMPVGQKRLRSLLIEAAWMWKYRDPYAAQLYNRMLGRMSIPQKAIVAVARRLAIILWRLCVEQRPYRYGTV
jgi:transposase